MAPAGRGDGLAGLIRLDRGRAVEHTRHLVAVALQVAGHHLGQALLVLHHQHTVTHAHILPARGEPDFQEDAVLEAIQR